jgi:pimeloyl-ACP methyl ester carboxylesterase
MIRPAATRYQTETMLLAASPADDPTTRLAIVEKRPVSADRALPPLLIAHGATFSGRIFDLPRAGYSLMESLAVEGRAVYALDIRGFGASLVPRVMDQPPGANSPFAGVDDAMFDLAAAVDLVLERQSVSAVDLAGFSWGAIVAARFAGRYPRKVRRLALYAPLYRQAALAALGPTAKGGVPREAYGLFSLNSTRLPLPARPARRSRDDRERPTIVRSGGADHADAHRPGRGRHHFD